jgi:hypothetical protein
MSVHHQRTGSAADGALRAAATRVLAHPSLWWPALRAAPRFAPKGWWRRPPFLPVPDERYWRFRMETAYGDEDASVPGDELADVLRWSRRAGPSRR